MSQVAILGASPKSHRFAFKAQRKLLDYGHNVWPVANRGGVVDGLQCVKQLAQIQADIDTVTVYINADLMEAVIDELIELKPRRVIFNPGTESKAHRHTLEQRGIQVIEACTLIMLDKGQF